MCSIWILRMYNERRRGPPSGISDRRLIPRLPNTLQPLCNMRCICNCRLQSCGLWHVTSQGIDSIDNFVWLTSIFLKALSLMGRVIRVLTCTKLRWHVLRPANYIFLLRHWYLFHAIGASSSGHAAYKLAPSGPALCISQLKTGSDFRMWARCLSQLHRLGSARSSAYNLFHYVSPTATLLWLAKSHTRAHTYNIPILGS